ncbi:MAG: alpha/beta hydrolase [Clostridiales bacterium]|nr:alpha/beta hydrolase [Clostridiales bacterium]
MTAFINIILTFTILFSGIASQLDFILYPEKYNAVSIDISSIPSPIEEAKFDGFVQLTDVRMHYMIFGNGEKPLILIHGNSGSVKSLMEVAKYLANYYTVYLPESRCHGQSSDPGVISYELMAKDLKEFIEQLGLKKPLIMGHSDGGINAIQFAADYPDIPGAIISCGANSHPKAFKLYFPLGVTVRNIFKPDKLNDMMLILPDFTPEYLEKITCPSYIVSGQFDIMWISDTVYLHENIKGSDMAIIKGADHSSYMSRNGKQACALAKAWFDKVGM